MVIPYGRTYTSKVSVKAWIPILCEHCGLTFAYLTSKSAEGSGSSLLWLDNEGASERAYQGAMKSLVRKLKAANDPFPCPRCAQYQSSMVRSIRRGFQTKGALVSLGGLFIWFFWTLFAWDSLNGTFWETGLSTPELFVLLGASGALLGGFVIAHRFNPEHHAEKHQRPPSDYRKLSKEEFLQVQKTGYSLAK
jgi:hypothetical protein